MSVSTTSFAERLTRLETSTVKLYAGNEPPQVYKSENLICAIPKSKIANFSVIMIGALFGVLAGYMFKTNVGIEMFFSQPLLVVFTIVKADPMTAAICAAMIAGPAFALLFQLFSRTKSRLAQFWWSYALGSIGANLMTWYYFYLSLNA